jgi:8-oxo-dGTP pyrophosphatase MutT (NUDIX family)
LGHITGSGLVIKDGKALLIFHPYIKQWFQPGGHIDDGEFPIEAAIREVYEETGILCESIEGQLDPVDIDLHEIPANPKKGEGAHLHIDLLFVLQVIEERDSPEDIQKAWVPFDQITSPRIKRALQKLQDHA